LKLYRKSDLRGAVSMKVIAGAAMRKSESYK